jgi:sulfite exporter TauE/SafE
MTAFGIGTLPAMFFMPLIAQSKWKFRLPKYALAIALTVIGLLTILRGFNLGIPYLSPEINRKSIDVHGSPSLECCKDTCTVR